VTVERWSPARVAALVRDPSALRAARAVSGAAHWPASGEFDDVLWGLCQGSAAQPYQVCVDLAGPAYRCSCPSRRLPCKHALGLLLRWSVEPFGAGGPPAWAAEWRAGRAARAARAAARTTGGPPADPVAAERRARQRAERVAAGMAELRRWLDDQVQQGLAGAERAGYRPFEAMAARLVDAQAPAAASAVRRLGGIAGIGPHWADRLLGELALLRLLVDGHDRLAHLPAPLAATVRSRIGFPVAADDVLAGPRVRDRWQVLGRVDLDEGTIASRRTWLRGADSGRFALLLSFAAPGQFLDSDAVPGTEFDAALCFYPGAWPLRALVAERLGTPRPVVAPAGAVPARAALAGWTAALAAEPWRHDVPVLLADVAPTADGWLTGTAREALPLAAGHREPWWLLAAAGGAPATVAAEWSAGGLRPLAAWTGGRYVAAPPAAPDGGPARPPELPAELLATALVGTVRRPWTAPSVTVGGRSLVTASAAGSVIPVAASAAESVTPVAASAAGGVTPVAASAAGGAPPPGRGTEPGTGRSPAGSAASLLEASAVALLYGRAGTTPAPGRPGVPPAPAETGPPLPPASGARLLRLLGDGGAPGGAQVADALLAEWLAAAAAHGGHVPPEALPALLDAGRRDPAIRAALARVAGRRGGWLAERRADWRWLLDEAPPADAADPAAWATGTAGERLAYLARLRAADPGGARDLLAASWAAESPEDRVRFLATFETGLSLADDAFLDAALDDRRREVREAALYLLRRLPGARLGRHMAARARAAVRLDRRTSGRDRLRVEPPPELDAEMRRDGVTATPARGAGAGAWLLEEVVAGAPLDVWTGDFARSPAAVLELTHGHDWETPLVHGWAKAAIRQHHPGWASALVANDARRGPAALREAVRWDLHLVLPPAELARLAVDAVVREDAAAHRLLALHEGDWPGELAAAVLETIAHRARADRHSWQLAELCRSAARAMPPEYADAVGRLAGRLDQEHAELSRVRPVAELARILTFRHEMHQEFE
jgi:Family of unknown function (DUF5691)/SWIM zinc finger